MFVAMLEKDRDDPAPAAGTNAHSWLKVMLHGAGQTDCAICLTPLDIELRHPHPASVQLDHIVPRARGGEHVVRNLHLAHKVCNGSKKRRAGTGLSLTRTSQLLARASCASLRTSRLGRRADTPGRPRRRSDARADGRCDGVLGWARPGMDRRPSRAYRGSGGGLLRRSHAGTPQSDVCSWRGSAAGPNGSASLP